MVNQPYTPPAHAGHTASTGYEPPIAAFEDELQPDAKQCAYCDAALPLDALECPSCGSHDLHYRCPVCGKSSAKRVCPDCMERAVAEYREATRRRIAEMEQAAKAEKARGSLGPKALLTFLMPYIGGYLLITPHTPKGWRIFGIVWCALVAVGSLLNIPDGPAIYTISALLCIAPVAVYAARALLARKG